MNFVDDAHKKVEEAKQQLEDLGKKELELAEAKQALADKIDESADDAGDAVQNSSLGSALGL